MKVADIKRHSARALGITRAQAEGVSRAHAISHPRQIMMTMCHLYSRQSLITVGKAFGGRDHTTVLHGKRQVAERCKASPSYFQEVATVCAILECEDLHGLKARQDNRLGALVTITPRLLLPAPKKTRRPAITHQPCPPRRILVPA